MSREETTNTLLDSIGLEPRHVLAPDVAFVQVHHNEVLGVHLVPGLAVDAEEMEDGIRARVVVAAGAVIKKPVHVCFGMLPEEGLQQVLLDIQVEEAARADVLAHCTFPNAKRVEHRMDAQITVGAGARYSYFERHVHGPHGGVVVLPKAHVTVGEEARFQTEFELLSGRAGQVDIDYEIACQARSVTEMTARIKGRGTDTIRIQETARLEGEKARAVLASHLALRDEARGEVHNTLIASAPGARGHVDCKEVVLDNAVAKAVPIVEVGHPSAHVTHEAAIGSVDSKQLETLLTRGLTEDEATELIIDGLLSRS